MRLPMRLVFHSGNLKLSNLQEQFLYIESMITKYNSEKKSIEINDVFDF